MLELHPEIVRKNGREEFVILPYEEFVALKEIMEDAEDLVELRRAKQEEGQAPTKTLDEVRRELGLSET